MSSGHHCRFVKDERKTEFMIAILQSMNETPKIDFTKLAEKCGYKNARCAQDTYHRFKRSIIESSSSNGSRSSRINKSGGSGSSGRRQLTVAERARQKNGELDRYMRMPDNGPVYEDDHEPGQVVRVKTETGSVKQEGNEEEEKEEETGKPKWCRGIYDGREVEMLELQDDEVPAKSEGWHFPDEGN